ncbi:hypothetical protein P7K49_034737 [Saguinus oedipus]|uniref:Uncharacterized protein n=1 Tax=Saguinus oedipus TaxID=9490 RepID=A0ABQ9TWG5_SAGOE|nr:hypothetical protein P7K49_034737 [Saguinus oedipus]
MDFDDSLLWLCSDVKQGAGHQPLFMVLQVQGQVLTPGTKCNPHCGRSPYHETEACGRPQIPASSRESNAERSQSDPLPESSSSEYSRSCDTLEVEIPMLQKYFKNQELVDENEDNVIKN